MSELLTLTFGQVLTPQGGIAREITINRQALKGGRGVRAKAIRSRRIPLNDRTRGAITDYIASIGSPPPGGCLVFRSRKGENQPIRRCQAHHVLKQAAAEAGIDVARIGCHSARKTFARGVYERTGHDLVKTQRLLGHSSPTTSARYLETTQDELDTVVLNFDPFATTECRQERRSCMV